MRFFVRTLVTLGIQPSTGANCPEGNLSFNSCSQYSVGQGIPHTNPQAKYRLNFQELGSYLQCNAWISIWHPPIRHSSRSIPRAVGKSEVMFILILKLFWLINLFLGPLWSRFLQPPPPTKVLRDSYKVCHLSHKYYNCGLGTAVFLHKLPVGLQHLLLDLLVSMGVLSLLCGRHHQCTNSQD